MAFKSLLTAAVLSAAAVILSGCVVWEQVERRQVAADYPAPGRLVDIGGRRMQIECRGAGSPTIVLETGLDYFGSLTWTKVYDPVTQFTRACAYSRAGIVWSDDKPGPHDGLGVARDLHATLAAAGEKGPFVLVGESLGGPYSSLFTGLYGDEVAGLVYVDASHPDQIARTRPVLGKELADGKGLIQGAGKWVSWTGAPRLVAMQARSGRSPEMAAIPQQARDTALAYFPKSLGPMVAEREAMPKTLQEAGAYRTLGARPVVVLTHGKPMADMPKAQGEAFDRIWLDMQKDMATWSSRGVQRTVADAGHNIPIDDPDAVIAAIRDVVEQVRSGK
jgi:pimeloyl-ACP methyl ester carboxylesterase